MTTKTIKLDPNIPYEDRKAIVQAAANLALSGMYPTEQCIRDAEAVARGEKTNEQVIQEIIARHKK